MKRLSKWCRNMGFYNLLAPWGCGSMDGGCVLVALAAATVYEVELYSVRNAGNNRWDHALIHRDGWFADGDGVYDEAALRAYWRAQYRQEIIVERTSRAQLIGEAQLPEGPAYDELVEQQLVRYFRARAAGRARKATSPVATDGLVRPPANAAPAK